MHKCPVSGTIAGLLKPLHCKKCEKPVPKNVKNTPLFHPRNPHQGHYDMAALCEVCPELNQYIVTTPRGDASINFSDAQAVLLLNTALLKHHYQINHWTIPPGYLCPPIPGRADYIHALADLLSDSTGQKLAALSNANTHVLDIGTGASCIYPLLGARIYGWQFTATDIDPVSVNTASFIVQHNWGLQKLIKPVLQKNKASIFNGIIRPQDFYHLSLCNPPFYRSLDEASAANKRKVQNLERHSGTAKQYAAPLNKPTRNFGGQKAELWCEGGELAFIRQMIHESQAFAKQVVWFTSLVSDQDNLKPLQNSLKQAGAVQVKVVNMGQGQKVSRLLAWSFYAQSELKLQ